MKNKTKPNEVIMVLIKDLDRTCYLCDKDTKILMELRHNAMVIEEYCLLCGRKEVETAIRKSIGKGKKFHIADMRPEKRTLFLDIMSNATKEEFVNEGAIHPKRQRSY